MKSSRFNPLNKEQNARLKSLIRKHGLQEVQQQIIAKAQNCIVIDFLEVQEISTGISRLGGLPDVPPDWEWPAGLVFLGQINLEDVVPHDFNRLLPSQGLLSFFHASDGFDQEGPGLPHRVFYYDGPLDQVQRAQAPRGYLPVGLTSDENVIYPTKPIELRCAISLPAMYTRSWKEICFKPNELSSSVDDAYTALLEELRRENGVQMRHHLLGHHSFIDGDADVQAWTSMHHLPDRVGIGTQSEEEKQATLEQLKNHADYHQNAATQPQDSLALESHLKMAKHFEQRHEAYLHYLAHQEQIDQDLQEWILLFQIDSDDRIGMQFWDAGIAYFMIRKTDLAHSRFDRVYASLWSS